MRENILSFIRRHQVQVIRLDSKDFTCSVILTDLFIWFSIIFLHLYTFVYWREEMWRGVLVEVRGYYKGACPSAMEVLRVELWWAKW